MKIFNFNVFFSKFTLLYFRVLSRIQLEKLKLINPSLKIIGISGSSGKTSTMNAIYAVLQDKFKVKYSYKANSETGIPLDILEFEMPSKYSKSEWAKYILLAPFKIIFSWPKYDIYIVEMGVDGIDEPKNMRYLLKIITPDIGVYINVDTVHGVNYEHKLNNPKNFHDSKILVGGAGSHVMDYIEVNETDGELNFNSQVLDTIARDKNLLVSALPKDGYLLLNPKDSRVLKSREFAKCETKEIFVTEIIPFRQLLPEHYNLAFEFAIAIGNIFKISRSDSIKLINKNFVLEPGRASIFEGKYNSVLIDSSYNSSPNALHDLIDFLDLYPKYLKSNTVQLLNYFQNPNLPFERIAILGDMRELGKNSKMEHRLAAENSLYKVDTYFLVGEDMRDYFKPRLIELGFDQSKIFTKNKVGEILKDLDNFLKNNLSNKIILIKGSQNTIFLEIAVKFLLKKTEDQKKLCRIGEMWDNKRVKFI
jgi:UDP-N-acetylmuramyl pentapeptide synthase